MLTFVLLQLTQPSVERFMERTFQLYEQEPPNKIEKRLGEYVLGWVRWVVSGLRISLDKKGRAKQKPCLFHVLVNSGRIFKPFVPKSCKPYKS